MLAKNVSQFVRVRNLCQRGGVKVNKNFYISGEAKNNDLVEVIAIVLAAYVSRRC